MKITVDVDCTPEEARRFMGLPDLAPVHDAFLGKLIGSVESGAVPAEVVEGLVKSWAPMNKAGMQFWQQMFDITTAQR